jgi:ArsR family transcriptional regulator, arsenate/arsenite/antimonite-responsive transcriptional repressor / arsenate reductase (thioredoxin)
VEPSGQPAPAFVGLAAHPLRWRLLTELARSDLRVRELCTRVGHPQNLVSYHLRLLRTGGLVTARTSSHDARDSYYHLDMDSCADALTSAGEAVHPALRLRLPSPPTTLAGPSGRPSVLFSCTGNSARSPIAEALLRLRAGRQVEVVSAGSNPRPRLHPQAVRVLAEGFGIDVADQHPRHLDTVVGRRFDFVITLCDKVREVCPDFDGHPRWVHWSIPDPAAGGDGDQDTVRAFTRVAAEIDSRIRHLLPVLAGTARTQEGEP